VPARVSSSYYLGLDWFVLDLLLVALVFVPLERVNPLRPQQRVFRPGLRTDIWYFFSSHVLVQVMSFCVLSPALFLSNHVSVPAVREVLRSQPVILQFFEAMFIADLVQYAVHRAFHRVPWLWRFHAIHHSAQSMDWIAGARLHLLDTIATRGAVLAALMVLGFSQAALQGYLVFVAFWATFIHANVAWELRWLSPWLATPVFHHWHHAVGTECMDKNFAVHFTVLDRWFGTYYLPRGRWPRRYGI
jgi:lathosterol oxidase